MTDEQLKAVGKTIYSVGFALMDLGAVLSSTPVPPPVDPPPIDPPPPPPVDPPVDPPPPVESEFMRKVVLRTGEGRFQPHETHWYEADPNYNVAGKSWGLSVKLFHHSPPTGTSPLSLWDDSSPQWQLKVPGPTRLAVALKLSIGGYAGFDEVVDDLTGRWAHVVVGYDYDAGVASLWIDSVLRRTIPIFFGVGHSPDYTPPLIVNSTAAGHDPGDISVDELVYAVGAAPAQADVDALSGIVPHAPGFFQSIEGEEVVVSAFGEGFADKPLHDPKPFLDGRFVEVKQTRNNPPLLKEWRGQVPGDVGREIQ
jgi:hypothetical protein